MLLFFSFFLNRIFNGIGVYSVAIALAAYSDCLCIYHRRNCFRCSSLPIFILHPITLYPHFSLIRCLFDECFFVPVYVFLSLHSISFIIVVWMCTMYSIQYVPLILTHFSCLPTLAMDIFIYIYCMYIVKLDRLDGILCRILSVCCLHCNYYEIIHKTCAMLNDFR